MVVNPGIVGDKEHCSPLVSEGRELLKEGLGVVLVEVAGGFVRQEELRVVEKGPCHRGSLLFPGAEGGWNVVCAVLETKDFEQFIDPFDNGNYLSRADAEELVRANTGRSFVPEYLAKSGERDIVLRMLRNLMGVAQESDPSAELLSYVETVVALQPDSAFDRWSRAVLLIQSRQFGAAKKDLEWLLQAKPTGLDLERVLEIYQSLQ